MNRAKKAIAALVGTGAILSAGLLSAAPAQAATGATGQGCTAYTYQREGYSTCVGLIQRMLNGIRSRYSYGGYTVDVDNSFGYNTENNAMAFQNFRGLTVDGIVGPNTWNQLCIYAGQASFYSNNDAWQAAYDAGCYVHVPSPGSPGGTYTISRY